MAEIINQIPGFEKGQEWISSRLEGLSRGMGIPIILVDVHEESVELQS